MSADELAPGVKRRRPTRRKRKAKPAKCRRSVPTCAEIDSLRSLHQTAQSRLESTLGRLSGLHSQISSIRRTTTAKRAHRMVDVCLDRVADLRNAVVELGRTYQDGR